ncbi:MAG: T9SS C-terminal target domain-containing protein [Bacteroidetes bacterium]|nr:MAG: T9SS C-terminal target domain-containing protein [Bacteroidota bacterium]REJ99744.1 MAG: T9SS C-terminal target domain-containing protein [Bacteroidota bacterium]REK50448.1 MAG: T9SS C-terminal target domain-containing protein [Bacteroidota bacterium]
MRNSVRLEPRQRIKFNYILVGVYSFALLSGIFAIVMHTLKMEESKASTAMENISSGSYIINMGITPQTIANGLKPYGLIYDMVKNHNVPVKWAISETKSKDGVDFTHNSVSYRGGTFIIQKEFITPSIAARIAFWETQGVTGQYSVSAFAVPVAFTITAMPIVMIDSLSGNQDILKTYYTNAGIPNDAYTIGTPAQLTACFDVWSNPHGDPTWPTHSYLYDFVTVQKSWIWAQCHSVSMMEGCKNPSGPQQLNFLTSNGLKCWGSNKCGPAITETHVKSPASPYSYFYPNDPVMQFMGNAHNASLGGSEQWFQPMSTGQWSGTARRGITTGTGTTPKEGTVLVYGPAFNNPANGWAMYQGGHDLNTGGGSASDRVSAQRAYFNYILQAGNAKKVNVTANMNTYLSTGQSTSALSVTTSGTPPYTYQWSSQNGGSFQDPTAATTMYTAPVVTSDTIDVVRVRVTDQCGRTNFHYLIVYITSSPLPVDLLSFNAQRKNGKVFIDWTSATEINNDYYTIAKSFDGEQFVNIGTVIGQGNSSVSTDYTFTDHYPGNGLVYYRLSQTDYDGSTEMLRTARVAGEKNKTPEITRGPVPNPFKDSFSVEIRSDKDQPANLSIFSTDGKLCVKKSYFLKGGHNRISFVDEQLLEEGIYLWVLKTKDEQYYTGKIIKD